MLSFSRFGKIGRLGNQLFQIAFLTSFAEKHNLAYLVPEWKYGQYFKQQFNYSSELEKITFDLVVREPGLGFHEPYFAGILPKMVSGNVDIITGYFQSYMYFSKKHVLDLFRPKVIPQAWSVNDRAVAISVRRGDFVYHPDYHCIDAEIYLDLLNAHFKNHKVFVFSDDFGYCRKYFSGPQYEFAEGLSDIEQLLFLSTFKNFILSNSTFSYWGPMLNAQPEKVFYPLNIFSDPQRCELYNQVYWPTRSGVYIPYHNPLNKPVRTLKS